jgi:plasmid rolling circle replication initiator protein Rep
MWIKEELPKKLFSLKEIIKENWDKYIGNHTLRNIEKEEVEKMLKCREEKFFACYCHGCNDIRIFPLGCNSRLCSSCGKRHTDNWAKRLVKRLFPGKIHRHLVFGMPDMLWSFIKENRKLQKIVMDAANQTIQELFNEILKKKKITQKVRVGVIAVLHPFGKDIGYKPHVHAMVTEGGFSKQGEYFSIGSYINYDALHRKWQYVILEALKPHIHKSTIDLAYRKYPHGFCAYVKPERISSSKRLIQYIGRYLRHPAIADSRIDYYDGKIVGFWYKDAEEEIQKVRMFVDDFIGAIIQHIPDKHEKLVRYYGAYSRIKRRPLFKQLTITNEILGSPIRKREIPCPKCKEKMQVIAYMSRPPPKDVGDIKKWLNVVS